MIHSRRNRARSRSIAAPIAVDACELALTASQLILSDPVKVQRHALVGCRRPVMGAGGTVIGSLKARHEPAYAGRMRRASGFARPT
jgi:hypothetical protein